MKMSRNASARSLLQNKISNSKGSFNPHTGKLAEEERGYDPKEQQKKAAREAKAAKAARQAEKSASFSALRSGGQPVDVVLDTGLVSSIRDYRKRQAKKVKTPVKGKIGRKYDPEKGFTVQGLTVRPERSNAKNEKTRLYRTYDNLLDEKEIKKKYNYVLNDKNTDEKAKGRAVRALLTPQVDYATYKKVAERQMELQKQKSGAGFAAGFLNATGGNVAKITAKGTKNEQARKNWMDTLNHLKETQEAHPTAGTLGAVTGEFAKAGAGYATFGKVAEKAVL